MVLVYSKKSYNQNGLFFFIQPKKNHFWPQKFLLKSKTRLGLFPCKILV